MMSRHQGGNLNDAYVTYCLFIIINHILLLLLQQYSFTFGTLTDLLFTIIYLSYSKMFRFCRDCIDVLYRVLSKYFT